VSVLPDLQPTANRRGILFMVISMTTFVGNDALVKMASAEMPSAQLIFIRGVFATIWIVLLARALGVTVRLRSLTGRWISARALVDAASTFTYLIALFHMPIANAIAINMAAPLLLTLLAVIVYRERVDIQRWVAVALGFLGVLLIIQPATEGFNAYSILCLGATLLHCVRDMMTRHIPGAVPSVVVTLATSLTVTLIAGAATLHTGWQPVQSESMAHVAGASVFLTIGYYFIILSTRTGDLSVIAPFRYSGLPVALLLGWLIWGDVPDLAAWVGIGLLCATGLYLLRRARPRPVKPFARSSIDASES
jgi:drug/metabolite transporter (DMT)-like permease